MKCSEFNMYDIICDNDYESEDIYNLIPELYVKAIEIGKEFEPVKLTIDIFSKIGFNVKVVDGLSAYLIVYEDLMLTPVFDPDTKDVIGFAWIRGIHYNSINNQPVMDVIEIVSPIKYVHQVQQLLRFCGYSKFANSILIEKASL